MNKEILNTEIQSFIKVNLTSNISTLILKGSPFSNVSIQELANQIIAKKKSKKKLPNWYYLNNIYYPQKISIEQTSSEITAKYKSTLISGTSIIDITGGFGVDCYAFSKSFKEVTHCEINTELSKIVKHNYEKLNVNNVKIVALDGLQYLKENTKKYDCIYIDPSRRDNVKGKVFLLKDCLPNVPENLDLFFKKTSVILIKNSPMLDISATINELKYVKEIHIIAVENEVKELLFLLEKGYSKAIEVKTINNTNKGNQIFDFEYQSKALSKYATPKSYLYEPNAAILKSGGFHQVSQKLNIYKLHQHSHLYTSDELFNFPGRFFEILNVIPYDKKQLKKIIPSNKANITIRNFPKTVVQIRKETKLKDGGDFYLFFTKNIENKNIVIICKSIKGNSLVE